MKTKKFFRENYHLVCLAIFTALLLVLNHFLYKQGDDYFYSSASAGTLTDFFQFHLRHYLSNNGRALIHFFVTLFLVGNGFSFWRIANPFIIAGVLYLAAGAFSAKPEARKSLLVCLCGLFLTIGGKFGSYGVYAMAPVFNYLYPLALVYTIVILFKHHSAGTPHKILLPILSFLAGATMEQTGMMTIGYLILLPVQHYLDHKKKPDVTAPVSLAAAIAGYLTVMLAPGNFVRMETCVKPFTENFVAALTMALNTKSFLLINLCVILCLSYWLLKLKCKRKIFNLFNIALCVVLFAGYAFNAALLFRFMGLYFDTNAIVHLIWVLYDLAALFALIYVPILIMIETGKTDYLIHAIMAVGSVALLLFASVSEYRPLIPAVIELFLLIAATVVDEELFRSKKTAVLCAALLVLVGCSYTIDLKGYIANYRVNEANHALIQEYLAAGETAPLHLYPYEDEDAAGYSCNKPGTGNRGNRGYALSYKRSEHLKDETVVIFDRVDE